METKELIETLRQMLPERVDYAELVGAEGFAYGCRYVYEDPDFYFIEEAADRLEQLQKERDAAIEDIRRAIFDDEVCLYCKHNYECKGKECDSYIEGIGMSNEQNEYFDWKWSCKDFEFGTCAKLENTPCNGCNSFGNFEWRGVPKDE